jgi:3-hydroxyacyl-CoA dehydrogenase
MTDNHAKQVVLGLGTMGRAMAQTAHRSGVPVVVGNRDPAVAEALSDIGIEPARSVHLALSDGGPERFKVLAALATEWDEIVDRGLGLGDVIVVTQALSE